MLKISLLSMELPQKATEDFMLILQMRKEVLHRVVNIDLTYDEKKARETVLEKMQQLFLYAAGWSSSPEHELNELIEDIITVVYMGKDFPVNKNVFWKAWMKTPLGYLVRMTIARMKYNHRENLNAVELSILSGTNPSNITHLIKRKTIKAEKDGINTEWTIPFEEAQRYLEEKKIGIKKEASV